MVKKIFLLLAILFSTNIAICAEFSSSISHSKIPLDENIVLTLSLSDANIKSSPDLSKLKKDFDVIGTSQYSKFIVINSKSSSINGWNLTLKAKKTGNITIDAITIDTNDGKLSTLPLQVEVVEPAPISSSDKDSGMFVKASTSQEKLYQYQPFIFSVKLHTKHPVSNIRFEKLNLENATVKSIGDFEIYNAQHQGEENTIAMHYLITPLKPTNVTIPKLKVTAIYEEKIDKKMSDIFDSRLSPEVLSQRMLYKQKEFTLQSKEIKLDILPPEPNVTPWLPAQSIMLNENMDTGSFSVGKPISRSIIINARGLQGKQLPDPIDILAHNNSKNTENYRIYADSPKITDNITKESILSSRQDDYTIIPQKAGKLILPAIIIKWWDIKNSKLVTSSIPAKTIEILPNNDTNQNDVNEKTTTPEIDTKTLETVQQHDSLQSSDTEHNLLLYLIVVIFMIAIGFVAYKFNQLIKIRFNFKGGSNNNLVFSSPVKKPYKSDLLNKKKKKINISKELTKVSSAKELYSFLKNYAHCALDTSSNASLHTIYSAFKKNTDAELFDKANKLIAELEDALYSNKKLDIEKSKKDWSALLRSAGKKKNKTKNKKTDKLPSLNP